MSEEEYTGSVSDMKSSEWLASSDIIGLGDVQVTIESVIKSTDVKMDGGRTEKEIYSLKFVGKDKKMVLNATNRKTLAKMFSASVKKWKGQKVKLYVEDGVRNPKGGSPVQGLRIKFELKVLSDYTTTRPKY
jgi:hypothetical protein